MNIFKLKLPSLSIQFSFPHFQALRSAISKIKEYGLWIWKINQLPQDIEERIRLLGNDPECLRIRSALRCDQSRAFDPILSLSSLAKMAKRVNSSFIHISGNCTLLSRCLLYNLKKGQPILSSKNTFPIYLGVSEITADQIVFGKGLSVVESNLVTLADVEEAVIREFETSGEKFYVISSSNYKIPLFGSCGHYFNAAVLLDEAGVPFVQFVDAWKTSEILPTREQAEKRNPLATFEILKLDSD